MWSSSAAGLAAASRRTGSLRPALKRWCWNGVRGATRYPSAPWASKDARRSPTGRRPFRILLRTVHFGGRGVTLNKFGHFEAFLYPGIRVFVNSAVGGGSHGWFGMLMKPQDSAYWSERHPGLNPSQVEKYYDKIVADMGGVRLCREHFLPHSVWEQLPDTADGKCRPTDVQPHAAIKLPSSESEVGQVIEGDGGIRRQTCAFDGDGFLGSRGGAKASVDFIYLAPALNNGATVRDMCEATKYPPRRGRKRCQVHGDIFRSPRGEERHRPRQTCHSCCRHDEHAEAAFCRQFAVGGTETDAVPGTHLWRQRGLDRRVVQEFGRASDVQVRSGYGSVQGGWAGDALYGDVGLGRYQIRYRCRAA